MPKKIQNIIKIDKHTNTNLKLVKSEYNKIINSTEIDKLDNLLNKKCVNEPSLYNISTEIIIDDFIIKKIPKGTNIYKGFNGFYNEVDILTYSKKHINNPSWFGNKYFSYKFAKEQWGSLVSFKLIEDIFLIDFYNIHNIKKIIEILELIPELDYNIYNIDNKEKFIYKIKIITGYNVSLLDQIIYIQNNIIKWKEFWIYTTSYYKKHYYFYNYCNLRVVDKLNPLGYLFTLDNDYIQLFNIIINKLLPNIDGIIRDEIYSSINTIGKTDCEELIIKNASLLKKLKFNYDDPLSWVNSKNKSLQDYKLHFYPYNSNVNFVLSEFYKINTLNLIPLSKYNVLSYNVHSFINLHIDITYETNINNIINLINNYKNNLDIISFQEMLFVDNKTFNYFYNKIKDKFLYYYHCSNGSNIKNNDINVLSIFVFTNRNYKSQIINLQLSLKEINYINKKYNKLKNNIKNFINTIRNIIILETEYGKIAFIHLEIGLRDFNNLNPKIKKLNSEVRIIMLNKILAYNPNIIIGDMNFILNDIETNFLNKNNYYQQNNDTQNSTPYNRVDHCFIRKSINNKNNKIIKNNKLLKCNYSDHLPMFQKLEPITHL